MVRITAEDTHILALVALPPDGWNDAELNAEDCAKLAMGIHTTGLIALSAVAEELGFDFPVPRPGASSLIDFANALTDEIKLRRQTAAVIAAGG